MDDSMDMQKAFKMQDLGVSMRLPVKGHILRIEVEYSGLNTMTHSSLGHVPGYAR